MARRPGQLTEEDKLKLQSQGLPPDCQDELEVVEARCKLDKRLDVVEIKSGQNLSREEVVESVANLLRTTQMDGGILGYYFNLRPHRINCLFELT